MNKQVRICVPPPKILMLGEAHVGKSAIVHKLFGNSLTNVQHKYASTQCVDVYEFMDGTLWDCPSNHQSQLQTRHIRGTTGAILVCDLSVPFTQKQLWYWSEKVLSISPRANIHVVANVHNVETSIRDDYLMHFLHEFPNVGIHVINIRRSSKEEIAHILSNVN